MKRKLNSEIKVYHYDSYDEIVNHKKVEFPFDKKMLNLLKEENLSEQEYYYLEKGNKYAIIIIYKMKLNIFTFGKLKCFINMKVIGYPCSLSEAGYVTNDDKLVLDFVKLIKGAKLVLNAKRVINNKDYCIGETLPTCVLYNSFDSISDYLSSLRSSYRRRINKAINNCNKIVKKEITDDSIDIYDLYINTYNKSDYKLEKLEKGFFNKIDATKLVFLDNDVPVGFVLLKKVKEELIFMFCGMDYNHDTTDLYYYMIYSIIEYAIDHKCKRIDLGQTSEETKMKFGAVLEKRYFYANHSNKVLNFVAKVGKGLLEYKYKIPNYRVFKEDLK